MDKSIIPECFADTMLIQILVPPNKDGYNHQHNCFKVEATMRRLDGFALGIIDQDKKQIRYLEQFKKVDSANDDLILWRHNDKAVHHWIIQICPALELFLLKICKTEGIDLSVLGEDELEGMKFYTKSIERLKDKRLTSIFAEINTRNDNLCVRKLKLWVMHLKNENYKADLNTLING